MCFYVAAAMQVAPSAFASFLVAMAKPWVSSKVSQLGINVSQFLLLIGRCL